MRAFLLCLFVTCFSGAIGQTASVSKRVRDYGVKIGVLQPGKFNAITDVPGVAVGHITLNEEPSTRTGVTAIVPHPGNIFQSKVPAGIYVENGFGKLAGISQVVELGNIETPIILTNTLSIAAGISGVVEYTLAMAGNEKVQSVNAVVGETNDGYLNDIRAQYVKKEHVLAAIRNAKSGRIEEGNVGAGTGTVCFGFKGGIGTSSRILPKSAGGYTVGVLVQTNFGGVLSIDGVPVGEKMKKFYMSQALRDSADGSCMIVIATDAPLDARNLTRLAKRSLLGLGRTGGIASNGSGDYAIAFSTDEQNRVLHSSGSKIDSVNFLRNDEITPLFLAVIEATEEAIINSLFMATTMSGKENHMVESLPIEEVLKILKQHGSLK
jgi:D-aminopeptidase